MKFLSIWIPTPLINDTLQKISKYRTVFAVHNNSKPIISRHINEGPRNGRAVGRAQDGVQKTKIVAAKAHERNMKFLDQSHFI